MTMAAGAAAMRLFDRAAFDRLSGLGERLRKGLREIVSVSGAEAHVSGHASIAGLFQGPRPGETYRDLVATRKAFPARAARMEAFFRHMLNNGVLIGASGFFVLSTALTEADIDFILDKALEGMRAVENMAA